MSRNADSSNEGADRTRPVQPVEQSQHEGVNASDQVILSGPVPVKNLIIPWKKRVLSALSCRFCNLVAVGEQAAREVRHCAMQRGPSPEMCLGECRSHGLKSCRSHKKGHGRRFATLKCCPNVNYGSRLIRGYGSQTPRVTAESR